MFDKLHNRLDKLEMSQRFTSPNVATDPTNGRNGDIWLNTTSNALKVKDSVGITETINLGFINYTPTISASTGTITSYTSAATYVQIGKFVSVSFSFTITNNGTGAGAINMNVPLTPAQYAIGATRENAVVGTEGQILVYPSSTAATLFFYNNTYPGGTNYQIIGTLNYITV